MSAKQRIALLLFAGALLLVSGVLARPALSALLARMRAAPFARASEAAPLDASHYARQSAYYAGIGETRKLVLLGDSRIEFADWTELFARCDLSNRGISGDTTEGVRRRLQGSMPTGEVVCVLQVGVNDLQLNRRIDAMLESYRAILDYLVREKRNRVIVTSIISATAARSQLNTVIAAANRQLAVLAANVGAEWVDLNAVLSAEGALAPEYSVDAVHLNYRGYTRVRDALVPHLERAAAPVER